MNANFQGIHFLVEGEDDGKFWRSFVNDENISLVICEGKEKLVGASGLLSTLKKKNITGVYDRDFDGLNGVVHHPNMLISTDENDLEITIVRSRALRKAIAELAAKEKVKSFEEANGLSVENHVERLSSEFGKLRFLNHKLSHRVDFDKLSPYRFINANDWMLNVEELRASYAQLASISNEELISHLHLHIPIVEPWQLSQGHDVIRIISQGLKFAIGERQINERDLGIYLRLAYEPGCLQKLKMYNFLKSIENTCGVKFLRFDDPN
ncbi:DUF4435 domain-containing protein [Comamonas sp. MYb69]|uniref:DUF4435 domain-containing protein n=1 Tax=Comamonas sp. MYb69 TaxID=1848650 RepID=UPI0030DB25F2